MKLRNDKDDDTHVYMVRCEELHCKRRRYPDLYPSKPFAAMQSAERHARRVRGHVVYVMDLTTLEAAHRYEIVTPKDWTEVPPY